MEGLSEHPSITEERLEWGNNFVKDDDSSCKPCKKCKELFSTDYYVTDFQGSDDLLITWNLYESGEIDNTLCSLCIYKMSPPEYNEMKESFLKKSEEERKKLEEERIKWECKNTRYVKCIICQDNNIPYVYHYCNYVYNGPNVCKSCQSFISSGKLLMNFIDKKYPELWQEFLKWKELKV